MAAHEIDARAGEPLDLAVVGPVRRDRVTSGQRRRDVHSPADRLPRPRDRACGREHRTRPEERLGGHARPVGALPAGELPLDHGDPQPMASGSVGGVLADRPRTHDDNVNDLLGVLRVLAHGAPSVNAWVRPSHRRCSRLRTQAVTPGTFVLVRDGRRPAWVCGP
ncbi:hypothetical protein GALL_419590 [mine drainage metagenome]|uniref:Uncharacterized protein n=1 Tax=mine drainage metagenome TaxID=410659 RepID=A0A1J5Q8M0_9ZZZZ